ncbi:MAG: NADPH-dependent assimilatory sulfite reductase hemoprotein subunit [Gemmataceae bacterium]|nr:NADPH-dependent assimilatory sulfite reductase hemoprotein subunit [Gemmataceae bacterium]
MSTDTASTAATSSEPKLSPVEAIKENSRSLRGTIAEEFADPALDHLSEANKQLIKFHGSYQQEDRDARKKRDKPGVGKAYMFMVRLKLPGGKLTGDQYLAMDDICGKYANGTLRITTRQSFQFHGILKPDMKSLIRGINAALVTSLGGCGDVNRNVLSCPAPLNDPARKQMQELADAVAAHLAPRAGARAYHEIWLNGEQVEHVPAAEHENPEANEPIYGKVYLPRKFKTAFSLPHDNCTDILAQCLGFLCVTENGKPVGYNLYAGGGQGQTNGNPDTFPHLARAVCFVEPGEVVRAAEGICKLFRDHGNRANRKRARLKYVMHDWGVEKFREVFARDYFGQPLRMPKDVPITGLDLHLGWQPQGDGKWFLGLSVENGRIKDEGTLRLRSGLRAIVSKLRCNVRLTAQQDVLLCDIATADRPGVDSLLNEYGISRPESLTQVRKWSMACPAIPTCGLAITEAERALPTVTGQLAAVLAELGLGEELISVRMTGCPNGCARPYQSEVGLVGRGGTKYTMYIGGDTFGRRLNTELQDSVPIEQIVPKLKTIFTAFKAERTTGEAFGDYCTRVGIERLQGMIGGANGKG